MKEKERQAQIRLISQAFEKGYVEGGRVAQIYYNSEYHIMTVEECKDLLAVLNNEWIDQEKHYKTIENMRRMEIHVRNVRRD